MSTSRRNFLKNGTIVALAAGVPLGIAAKVSAGIISPSAPAEAGSLDKAAFEAALNSKFVVNANQARVSVKLIDVQDLGSRADGREAFSLMFRGDVLNSLQQNTYVIEHDQLGTFSFLLVPMKRDDRGRSRYEAVINRLY
ncbi:MAG TPA: twin-arginine translocation signal domain-containing protein [Pyrinomonadaceae bacterium]|nr:twin-arginine translocation signal domain-containing protein [Pyrinomonadaceae bacterium]